MSGLSSPSRRRGCDRPRDLLRHLGHPLRHLQLHRLLHPRGRHHHAGCKARPLLHQARPLLHQARPRQQHLPGSTRGWSTRRSFGTFVPSKGLPMRWACDGRIGGHHLSQHSQVTLGGGRGSDPTRASGRIEEAPTRVGTVASTLQSRLAQRLSQPTSRRTLTRGRPTSSGLEVLSIGTFGI